MKLLAQLVVSMVTALAAAGAHCQVAGANLAGKVSLGTGSAVIGLTGTALKAQITFQNLDDASQGAFIMCCSSDPAARQRATGNLMGTSDARRKFASFITTFDTDRADFWDSGFSGGDAKAARNRLSNALKSGQAGVAITSDSYPAAPPGEIDGGLGDLPSIHRMMEGKLRHPEKNDFVCNTVSDRCVIPVYVSSSPPVDGVSACTAEVAFDLVKVPRRESTTRFRIVWQLVAADVGDLAEYRFSDGGVALKDNTPSLDFNGGGRDSTDGKRYRWLKVGLRRDHPVQYTAYVERLDPSTGLTIACSPPDPTIANTN